MMGQFTEFDFQLENEILEWSEEYNINNEALFSLIEILKTRWPSQNLSTKCKNMEKKIQCDYSDIFLDTVNCIGNGSLKEYLEDLKRTQKAILNEIKAIRSESDFENENSIISKDSSTEQKKILCFPIENLNHFQLLEDICSKNKKLYEKLSEIFLSNVRVQQSITIQDSLNISFNMVLERKLILYLSTFFVNVCQLERCSIFRCLKDAMLEKFPTCKDEDIFLSILNCFKENVTDNNETAVIVDSINREEENAENDSEEHLGIDLELILLDLPCNTIKDLYRFEEQSKELNFALISFFKSGPRNDCRSLIYFVMKKIFGQSIIPEIEWENTNGAKVQIKYFNITEILIEFVLQNFNEVSYEEEVVEIIMDWLNQQRKLPELKKTINVEEKENNVIEVELIESPICDVTDNAVEVLDFHEEFLEEENLFNLLPCKTESSLRKLDEACRSDLSFQKCLKEFYFSRHNPVDLIGSMEDDIKSTNHQYTVCDIQNDFKPFIEYNIRKIASDEVISMFSNLVNEKPNENNENLNYCDISVLGILQVCAQQKYPSLSSMFIKNQINLFVNKTKENLKNWSIIKKTEECRMKLQNVKPPEIITPDSHSIHLQSIFNLPLNTYQSLQDFNIKCLNSEEMSLNLMTMFLQATEYDCNKFVDQNLRKLITENMGGKLTWNGIQENIAIKDFYIMKLLIDATKKNFPNRSEEAIIDSIKLALKRFKDRVRKRKTSVALTENLESNDNKVSLDTSIQNEEMNDDIAHLKNIPCRTITEFQNFEKFCRKCKKLRINLKNIFDANPNIEDTVKFISENLKKIVVDSVLSNFTYNGLKNNIGIKYYTIVRLLMDSLIGKNPYISEEDAIKALKKALLLAKDRQRSMYKKRKKINK